MTTETSNARGELLRPKLENIISGHRINADDADWLRGLLAAAPPPAATHQDAVTRESALDAIEHVTAHNGPGRDREAVAMLVSAQQPASVFRNDGNTEAAFIAHEANACTACGGSGHKDDQQPAAMGEARDLIGALQVAELALRERGLQASGEYRQIEAALAKYAVQQPAAGAVDAISLLRDVVGQLDELGCGACIGSMAPMEDLHGRIAAYLATQHQEPTT